MPPEKLKQSMYGARGASVAQRVTLAMLVGCCTALAWWLLFGGGIGATGAWFGHAMQVGDRVRRASVAIALSIYFIRLLFTEFVFLRRGVSWTEAFTIAPWCSASLCFSVSPPAPTLLRPG